MTRFGDVIETLFGFNELVMEEGSKLVEGCSCRGFGIEGRSERGL